MYTDWHSGRNNFYVLVNMKYLAIIILVAFLGIIFLGFIPLGSMDHSHMDTAESPCPFAALLAASCSANIFSMIFAHMNALRSLSNVVISTLVIFAVFMVSLAYGEWRRRTLSEELNIFKQKNRQRLHVQKLSPVRERELSWLSLFELSPSFA
jgi:hypothetical protein